MQTLSAECRELSLYTDNLPALYHQTNAIYASLARKVMLGTYNADLAPRAFFALAENAARAYCREFCEGPHQATAIFPPACRVEFGNLYAEFFESAIRNNTLDDLGNHAARILRAASLAAFMHSIPVHVAAHARA